MPIRIICRHCSYVLYSGREVVSVREVVARYGMRCPRCLRPLSPSPREIVIERVARKR